MPRGSARVTSTSLVCLKIASSTKNLGTSHAVILILLIEKHDHGFRCGSAFIQQGSIGNRKAGKIAHHGLEIQQAFQTSLGYFCLVRSVLGIPSRVFENISENNAGCNGIIISLADIVFKNLVF